MYLCLICLLPWRELALLFQLCLSIWIHLALPVKHLDFLIAMFSFSQFIFSPLAGDLSDKHGRKNLIIVGLIIFGLSQLTFGFSTELWMLYVSRFFSGLGSAFLVPPMMAFVADITTFEERGKGMGLLGASMSLGFMIGPAIGGFLSKISLEFPFYRRNGCCITSQLLFHFLHYQIRPAK